MPRVRRLQAIGSEVQSNEIRLLVLMPRLEVKAGTAGGGHRGMMRHRYMGCRPSLSPRLAPLFENDPEGVTFEQPVRGTKPFSGADETTLKQRAGYPHLHQAGDDQNAVFVRIDLEPVTQQLPRRNGSAGGRAMMEATAGILTLISVVIFAAHALDAYRTH